MRKVNIAIATEDNPYLLMLQSLLAITILFVMSPAVSPAALDEPIAQQLLSRDNTVRGNAMDRLRYMGTEEKEKVLPHLITALLDKDSRIRHNALETLRLIYPSNRDLDPFYIQGLNDNDGQVRLMAVMALEKSKTKEAVTALSKALNDTNSEVRRFAAASLGNIGTEAREAVPALIQRLHIDDGYMIAEALGKIGYPSPLLPLLKDKDKNVRKWVAYALGKMGPSAKEAVSPVTVLFTDLDSEVRIRAIEAIGNMGPEANTAVPALINALKDHTNYYYPAMALGKMGPAAKESIPTLVIELKTDDDDVRLQVALALVSIDPSRAVPAIPALAHTLKQYVDDESGISEAAAEALVKIGKPAVPVLIYSLNDKNRKVRSLSAQALGKIGPHAKNAETALNNLLKDKDPHVRKAAQESLRMIRRSSEN